MTAKQALNITETGRESEGLFFLLSNSESRTPSGTVTILITVFSLSHFIFFNLHLFQNDASKVYRGSPQACAGWLHI